MRIDKGWQVAPAAPDAHSDPGGIDGLDWRPVRVPGTAAAAFPEATDLDASDWWFRTTFGGDGDVLMLDGIATVAQVFLNGELVLESESMFECHEVDVSGRLREGNELAIRCRALKPLLAIRRKPRARWRTQLVYDGNLRWFRTMLLGRCPGFAPGPAAVGPWRPVRLERRDAARAVELRARLDGRNGVLFARSGAACEVEVAGQRAELPAAGGELRIPGVEPWWPHTHGRPALHEVRVDGVPAGRVGFRTISSPDPLEDGLDLHVNGVPVFARGAVWTPVDPVGMAPSRDELRATLEAARDAGMNMLRIPGTAAYESADFFDICDEVGLLVWQDFMFANLDYPVADPGFRSTVEREAASVMAQLAGRPSVVVVCGNSEVEQQVAMLGLDPEIGRGELFGELLPEAVRASGSDALYVPSSPSGGDLPFRPDRGIAHYFGVGGYRRPLEDARRAGVRFAGECLAIANVPGDEALEALGHVPVHHPRWKAGVPRDVGTGWDFDDVRDHYLELLFGVDPVDLRSHDNERYLELSRAVSGEVMAEVFGEWRRGGSRCAGGIVLWLRDLQAGAGWGLLDHTGAPKTAYHHLRRALAPVAAWTTDEGLGGILAHVANDRPEPLRAGLRVALYRDLEQRVEEAREEIELGPRAGASRDVEAILGRFADVSWAYRFGPPAQDAVVVTLEDAAGAPLSQAFRFPAGRPLAQEPADRLSLKASAEGLPGGSARLTVSARRLVYGLRIHAPGWSASDDAFSLEPGGAREVILRPLRAGATLDGATATALNLDGRVRVDL